MKRLLPLALLMACGPPPAKRVFVDDDPPVAASDSGRPALQLYLVLTADTGAMPDKAAVDAMFQAINTPSGPRHAAVRDRVKWAPPGYQLDIALDFADLPHAAFPEATLNALLAELPPPRAALARRSKLAITLRSEATTLPHADQVRLAGLAALYVADTSDGVIVDLLSRRAWTPDAWQAELARETLGPDLVRITRRADAGGSILITRGNPKFGAPDLRMGPIPADRLAAAEALFARVQAAVLVGGATPGQVVEGATLTRCDAAAGAVDWQCVQVPVP